MENSSELKLNRLNGESLTEQEMNILLGRAGNCCCGCNYANSGGSSNSANDKANNKDDLSSPDCYEEEEPEEPEEPDGNLLMPGDCWTVNCY